MQLSTSLQRVVQQKILDHDLPDNFIDTVQRWYLPVAAWIAELKQQSEHALLISFNGAQGSG